MSPTRKIAFVSPLASAYIHRLVRGALSYAETQSGLVIRDFHVPRDLRRRAGGRDPVSALLAWQPDGLLSFLEDEELDRFFALHAKPCPVVSMCNARPRPGVAVVSGSFAAEVKVAVEHFRQQGLRSIVMLMLEGHHATMEQTFLRIARPPAGLRGVFLEIADPALLDDPEQPVVPVSEPLAAWLESLPKPSGVFCPEVGGGGYVIRVCRALGLRIPEDIAVIGSDDADLSLASHPTLTSVIPVGEKIGFEAARLLVKMMEGKPSPRESVRFDAMDLRVRQSTGLQRAHLCDIAGALDHINQHACGGLTVAQLLKATQRVSGKTFHTHFKQATGMTPGEAIQHRKLEEARRLLAGTRLSLTLVAEQCGFGSSSDFARRFRAVEGLAPSAFRQQATRSD